MVHVCTCHAWSRWRLTSHCRVLLNILYCAKVNRDKKKGRYAAYVGYNDDRDPAFKLMLWYEGASDELRESCTFIYLIHINVLNISSTAPDKFPWQNFAPINVAQVWTGQSTITPTPQTKGRDCVFGKALFPPSNRANILTHLPWKWTHIFITRPNCPIEIFFFLKKTPLARVWPETKKKKERWCCWIWDRSFAKP